MADTKTAATGEADHPVVAELEATHPSSADNARSYASSITAAPAVDKTLSTDSDALSRKDEGEFGAEDKGTKTPEEIERESKYLTGSAFAFPSSRILFLRIPSHPKATRRGWATADPSSSRLLVRPHNFRCFRP